MSQAIEHQRLGYPNPTKMCPICFPIFYTIFHTLKLIFIYLEKRRSLKKSLLILLTLAISWLTYSPSPLKALGFSTFVTSLVHDIYAPA